MAGFGALIDLTVDSESKQVVAKTPNQRESAKPRDTHQITKTPPRLASAPATTNHSQRPLGSSSRHSLESRNSSGFPKQASRAFHRPQALASPELHPSRMQDTSVEDVEVLNRSILPGLRKPTTKSFVDLTRDYGGNRAHSQAHKHQFAVRETLPEEARRSILTDSEEDSAFRFPSLFRSSSIERNQNQLSDRGKSVSTPTDLPSFKFPEAGVLRLSSAQGLEAPSTPCMETTADWAVLRSSAQKSATEAAASDRKHWDALASTTARTAAEAIPDSPSPRLARSDLSSLADAAKRVEAASKEYSKPQALSNALNGFISEAETEDETEDEADQVMGNGNGNGNGNGSVTSEAFTASFTLPGTDEEENTRKSLMTAPSRKYSVRQPST